MVASGLEKTTEQGRDNSVVSMFTDSTTTTTTNGNETKFTQTIHARVRARTHTCTAYPSSPSPSWTSRARAEHRLTEKYWYSPAKYCMPFPNWGGGVFRRRAENNVSKTSDGLCNAVCDCTSTLTLSSHQETSTHTHTHTQATTQGDTGSGMLAKEEEKKVTDPFCPGLIVGECSFNRSIGVWSAPRDSNEQVERAHSLSSSSIP